MKMKPIFELSGFSLTAYQQSKQLDPWRQGDINCLINYKPVPLAAHDALEHAPSAIEQHFASSMPRRRLVDKRRFELPAF